MNLIYKFSIVVILLAATYISNVHAGIYRPSNYAECLLENLKGATNYVAAEVAQMCLLEFPEGFDGVKPKPSIIDTPTPYWRECALENIRDITVEEAAMLVRAACHWLYPPPELIAPNQ